MDPRVAEQLAIIRRSMKEPDKEASDRVVKHAKQEIKAMTNWDENKVEEEISRYVEGKRDPSPKDKAVD